MHLQEFAIFCLVWLWCLLAPLVSPRWQSRRDRRYHIRRKRKTALVRPLGIDRRTPS